MRPIQWTRRKRWAVGSIAVVMLLLLAGELLCRLLLGLGDPPLSVADPEIEYLFKPSMTYRRFGRIVSYNAWSMRSRDFPKHKTDPRELRVLVFGDSVVNGGALTDQSELATSMLESRLAQSLNRPVIVGNISAGSWGPPNLLAYAKRFGMFDADVVIVVLSSHDDTDVPTFEPAVGVNLDMPAKAPALALQEAITRYLLPRIAYSLRSGDPIPPTTRPADLTSCLDALRDLVALARSSGAKVIIAQHLAAAENVGEEFPGYRNIRTLAEELNAERVDLGPAFKAAQGSGQAPYRDIIHPSPAGQKIIADLLHERVVRMVAPPSP